MKKLLFTLAAGLLAVLMFGCGKTPDEELAEKIPASVNSLCLIDGNLIVQTNLYKEHQKEILKSLKDASLTEDLFLCRVLFFGSTKEEWGGALVQSAGGQVRKLFDKALAESKKEKNFKELKETAEGRVRKVTGSVEGKKFLALLYHDNLMLIALKKTDPAFFKAKSVNPLVREISWQGSIVSAAVKVELPQQGKSKEAVDGIVQMVPALKKLRFITGNIPFSAAKPELDFRMIFQEEEAAREMLAAVNVGLGFLTQSGDKEAVKMVKMIGRKAEKTAVCISLPLTELAGEIDRAQKKSAAKAERLRSVSNLKQIAVACKTFAIGHKGKFPDDLTDLVKGECLADPKVFIAPSDPRRKVSPDKVIRPSNTSYAYVGKGLSEEADPGLPLAFEKPDVVGKNAGTCTVLYVGGHVLRTKAAGRTCKAIAQELTAKLAKTHAGEVALILANAAAQDQAE